MTKAEIAERARTQVSIREVKRLDRGENDAAERAYSIGFEASTPEAAVAVANRLASALVQIDTAKRQRQQEVAISLLRSQLEHTQAELDQRNEAIAAFRRQNRGIASERPAREHRPSARARRAARQAGAASLEGHEPTSRRPGSGATDRGSSAGARSSGCAEGEDGEVEDQLGSLEAAATLSREEYLGLKRELQQAELGGSARSTRSPAVACRCSIPPSRPRARWARACATSRSVLAASLVLAFVAGVALELLHPSSPHPTTSWRSSDNPCSGG